LNDELNEKVRRNSEKLKLLENAIKKLRSKNTGDKNVKNFEIEGDEVWELLERNLYKNGVLLEYEILNILKSMDIQFEHQDTFSYPKEPDKFYIDYHFYNNLFYRHKDVQPIPYKSFETDIVINELDKITRENIKVFIHYYYLIECKSRSNPPVNYLIFPDYDLKDIINQIKHSDSEFNSMIRLKSSQFTGDFHINSELWKTSIDPVLIKANTQNIDDDRLLEKAFWQLFKRVDYQSNYLIDTILFNRLSLYEIPIPSEIEHPKYLQHVNRTIKNLKKIEKKPISNNIILNVALFIPIIVVNGNIYAIDLNKPEETPLKEKSTKIPGFVKEYSHLNVKGEVNKFNYQHLTRFLMDFMRSRKICFNHDYYFPQIYEPQLDLIILSSSMFKNTFRTLKNRIETEFRTYLENYLFPMKPEKLETLENLKLFSWLLSQDKTLCKHFFEKTYDAYSGTENNQQPMF